MSTLVPLAAVVRNNPAPPKRSRPWPHSGRALRLPAESRSAVAPFPVRWRTQDGIARYHSYLPASSAEKGNQRSHHQSPCGYCGGSPRASQIRRRDFRIWRKIVCFLLAAHDEDRMRAPNAAVERVVNRRIAYAPIPQCRNPLLCPIAQFFQFSKLNRLCGAHFRACRHQIRLLTVIAECAFERPPVHRILGHHSERTAHHAVPAPVADIRLQIHAIKFGPHQRTCRTRLQAARDFAVLAYV